MSLHVASIVPYLVGEISHCHVKPEQTRLIWDDSLEQQIEVYNGL
jgi:hypothetical protein